MKRIYGIEMGSVIDQDGICISKYIEFEWYGYPEESWPTTENEAENLAFQILEDEGYSMDMAKVRVCYLAD